MVMTINSTLRVNTDNKDQHYSPSTPSKQTHHYFGYLNIKGEYSAPAYHNAIVTDITVIDGHFQEHLFTLPPHLTQQLQKRLKAIESSRNQNMYSYHPPQQRFIRLEVDLYKNPISFTLFQLPYSMEEVYPLYQSAYDFCDLLEFFELTQQIQILSLKGFIKSLINQTDLMQKFVSLPASRSYHHIYPGGLLKHSLECANSVKRDLDAQKHRISQLEREVTLLAALLHDIGKTETLTYQQGNANVTPTGYLIAHEDLNISVIYPSLEKLKQQNHQAARTLQYLLIWNHSYHKSRDPYCKFIGGNLIKEADRFSTGMDVREQIFNGKPSHHFFGKKGDTVFHRL